MKVFGQETDSVQIIVTSVNDSIWLSKKYGIFKAKYFDSYYGTKYITLDAIKELKKGIFLADLRRMYDFEIGDIFVKKINYKDYTSYPKNTTTYSFDTITSKTLSAKGDTIFYKINDQGYLRITELEGGNVSITQLTNMKAPYGSINLNLSHDTIQYSQSPFEGYTSYKFVTGLGLVEEIWATAGNFNGNITSTTTLVAWKTSKSTSKDYNSYVSSILGLEEVKSPKTFTVFPNPVSNNLYINASEKLAIVEVLDLEGKSLMSQELNENQTSLDVSFLSKNLYFLKVKLGESIYYQKFIKE